MEKNINLLECGDHKFAPWSIVCVHLMEGSSHEWMPVKAANPEVDFDWLCPECLPLLEEDSPSIEKLRGICIHCVRKLRRKFDPNFENNTIDSEDSSQ